MFVEHHQKMLEGRFGASKVFANVARLLEYCDNFSGK